MILDDGIATIFDMRDVSGAGDMPEMTGSQRAQSYYKTLSFETSPATPTERRIERRTDERIRILRCEVREEDEVELVDFRRLPGVVRRMRVIRAFHGIDDESGDEISDLTLEEVSRT